MPRLLQPILAGSAALVIGARTQGDAKQALLPQARFGNWLACFLIRRFFGIHYTDLGPFRAIRYPELLDLNMQDKTFGWTVEMQLKAAKRGIPVCEVPVRYRKRIGTSKITGTLTGHPQSRLQNPHHAHLLPLLNITAPFPIETHPN